MKCASSYLLCLNCYRELTEVNGNELKEEKQNEKFPKWIQQKQRQIENLYSKFSITSKNCSSLIFLIFFNCWSWVSLQAQFFRKWFRKHTPKKCNQISNCFFFFVALFLMFSLLIVFSKKSWIVHLASRWSLFFHEM